MHGARAAMLQGPLAARQQPGRAFGGRTAHRRVQVVVAALEKSVAEYVADGTVSRDEASSFSADQLEFLIRKRISPSAGGSASPGPSRASSSASPSAAELNGSGGLTTARIQGYVSDGTITQQEADTYSADQLKFLIRKRLEPSPSSSQPPRASASARPSSASARPSSASARPSGRPSPSVRPTGGSQSPRPSLQSPRPVAARSSSPFPGQMEASRSASPSPSAGYQPGGSSSTSGGGEMDAGNISLMAVVVAGAAALVGLAAGLYFVTKEVDPTAAGLQQAIPAKVEPAKSSQVAPPPAPPAPAAAAPKPAEPKKAEEAPKPAAAKVEKSEPATAAAAVKPPPPPPVAVPKPAEPKVEEKPAVLAEAPKPPAPKVEEKSEAPAAEAPKPAAPKVVESAAPEAPKPAAPKVEEKAVEQKDSVAAMVEKTALKAGVVCTCVPQ